MRFKFAGSNQDHVSVAIRSAEVSTVIRAGAPVFLDPTLADGVSVLTSNNYDLTKTALFLGIATAEIGPGEDSESLVYGFYHRTRIVTRSRAASTDNWPSYTAHNIGELLNVLTADGAQALKRIGTLTNGTGTDTSTALESANLADYVVLMGSLVSASSVASNSSNTSLFSYAYLKTLLRAL